ncbi:MAG: hypothetical protein QGG63_01620 [Candidatus Pacebacteria bacterium]|jgi:Holliday junction resolvase-like predicted endonuclease|nr:hypothetical protein [Candidatus Paceibacterota bacterium]|tara:strand:- start:27236 stop:27703 length:468 start_codon:yes stop_codon:yes gene_type:complete
MNISFSRNLIKGKIGASVFEYMFRESGKFTIFPFGYEHTIPQLAQFHRLAKYKTITQNIRNTPDFVLISQDKSEIFIVEVKYRGNIKNEEIKEKAEKLSKIWGSCWLFVASPKGFFFDMCRKIVEKDGKIQPLGNNWVDRKVQKDYLKLLKEFEI